MRRGRAARGREGSRAESRRGPEGLTPEGFHALLSFLGDDRELAGAQYETIRRRLVRLFEWRSLEFPEDLADETINRVARRIAEGTEVRTADPYGYFCGVAHLVAKEVWRRAARERKALEGEDWPAAVAPQGDAEPDGRLERLRRCLASLPEEQRRLILRYHQEQDHIRQRQKLAETMGIPLNALRIRVHRIRRKLEDCVREGLAQSGSK